MKYHNRKTEVDGIVFDSKAEAQRYTELIALQNLGVIKNLQLQKSYFLVKGGKWENGRKYSPVKYVADFVYELDGDMPVSEFLELMIVEDVKGFKTKEYVIKKKLMKERYGIEITEVKA